MFPKIVVCDPIITTRLREACSSEMCIEKDALSRDSEMCLVRGRGQPKDAPGPVVWGPERGTSGLGQEQARDERSGPQAYCSPSEASSSSEQGQPRGLPLRGVSRRRRRGRRSRLRGCRRCKSWDQSWLSLRRRCRVSRDCRYKGSPGVLCIPRACAGSLPDEKRDEVPRESRCLGGSSDDLVQSRPSPVFEQVREGNVRDVRLGLVASGGVEPDAQPEASVLTQGHLDVASHAADLPDLALEQPRKVLSDGVSGDALDLLDEERAFGLHGLERPQTVAFEAVFGLGGDLKAGHHRVVTSLFGGHTGRVVGSSGSSGSVRHL